MNDNIFTPNRVRTLINIFCRQSEGLNVVSLNARSIRPKFDELCDIFVGSDVHVILVCETWLHSQIPSALVRFPGYNIFRNDRMGRIGGGVAIYVRDCYNSHIVYSSECTPLEFLCVEVSLGADKCLLSSVYCPPNSFSTENAAEFSAAFSNLTQRYPNVVLGGDFNVNLLRHNSATDSFLFFLQSLHLGVINDLPTYICTDNPSLLDLVVIADKDSARFQN